LAQKINDVSAGVTASLIDGGEGNAYLTLTSATTGSAQRIQLADLEGDTLEQLGLANGAESVRESVTNGGRSLAFTSSSDTVATLLGGMTVAATSFSINGTTIDVDLSSDNLQTIADKINGSGSGASATLVSSTKDNKTVYQLEITGDTPPTFADDNNVLKSLGVLQKGYGNQLVAAQNAEYKLDGVSLSSATNTVTTAIPGATLTLLKANETTPEKSTLALSRDNNAIKGKIKAFADAYNSVVSFIRDNSQFDADSFSSGPLFGDATARQVEANMGAMLFSNVPGLTGDYKNLSSVGFRFDNGGMLTADDATLNAAIAKDPAAVGALFRSTGVGSSDDIVYVSSTSASKASGVGSYSVDITQLATKGIGTAGIAQTSANATGEKLTFGGSLFGSTPYVLNIDVGSTLGQTVDKINNDAKLKSLVAAREDNGKLVIESRRFGTSGNFTVASNIAAAADNSGIGYGGIDFVAGVDVAGTINGQASTGSGQYLTANADSGDASGIQIQYTGTTLGPIGNVQFRKGVAVQSNDMVGVFTDAVNGILSLSDKALQTQLDDLNKSITSLNTRITEKQQELRERFAAMEDAIARVQSQGQGLAALANGFASNRN
jgi:flagellar hook-associated protein 2